MKQLLMVIVAVVLATATFAQDSVVTAEEMAKESAGWGPRILSFDHYTTTNEEDYDYSTMTFDVSYKLSKNHGLRFFQGMTKKYNIPVDTNEFDAHDTRLYYYYRPSFKWNGVAFNLRVGATLPLSQYSIDHDRISTLSLRLRASKSFFNKKLGVYYSPYVSYYWNEYKQTAGGYPLAQWGIGNSLMLVYRPSERFSLVGVAAFGSLFMTKPEYRQEDEPINGTYSFDFYGSYAVVKDRLDLRLGYSQGKSLITAGRFEVYLFDERTTQLYMGLDCYL